MIFAVSFWSLGDPTLFSVLGLLAVCLLIAGALMGAAYFIGSMCDFVSNANAAIEQIPQMHNKMDILEARVIEEGKLLAKVADAVIQKPPAARRSK